MDYEAYETAEGEAMEGVELLCKHLTIDGSFNDQTQPTADEVHRQLTLAKHKIAARLAKAGYSTTQTAPAVLALLEPLNVLEVVIWAELASPITGQGEPNERFLAFREERDTYIELLDSGALGDLGATVVTQARQTIAATGISKAAKDAVYLDTDTVPARFPRDFGKNPRLPHDETAYYEETLR